MDSIIAAGMRFSAGPYLFHQPVHEFYPFHENLEIVAPSGSINIDGYAFPPEIVAGHPGNDELVFVGDLEMVSGRDSINLAILFYIQIV